ncbi:MAG TPA: DUF2130 domain-containing protein [Dehalococcoidia bacterium]|nr:DUF2130 domain-containing protein [Dehalococcoidia bacterium]
MAEENAAKLSQELDAKVAEQVLAKTADLESARHEKETQLERAQKTIETLQRQLDEKPSYVRGAMQESELLQLLQKEFPKDRIARVSGAGADIEHEVMYDGENCGVILYESKNVQTWNSDFIDKLNKDKLSRKASYAILVSTAFPSKSRDFDMIDGVPIVRPELLLGLVQIIRKALMDLRIQGLSGENKGFKHEQLMNYLQSPDFKNKIQNVLRAVGDLEELQMKERRYHDRLWEDEDKLQKEIRNSTFDVNTEIVGILAGR